MTDSNSSSRRLGTSLPRLVRIMQELLGPQGCPWDRAQTSKTLRPYLLEEACEVMDAIDSGNPDSLREELGDLLFQVIFHSELAHRNQDFTIDDVIEGICEKLQRRHPHVFGNSQADTPQQVRRHWEQIKAKEKEGRSVLEGVPSTLPALARAQRLGDKASRFGFDWPAFEGCRSKVNEELVELDSAISSGNHDAIEEELGDMLFALTNVARHLHVDAELALRASCRKFSRRFSKVEEEVNQRHGGFVNADTIDIDTLESYWQKAKEGEAT